MQGRHQTGCVRTAILVGDPVGSVRVRDRSRRGQALVGGPEHGGDAHAQRGGQVQRRRNRSRRARGSSPGRPASAGQVGLPDEIDEPWRGRRAPASPRRPVARSAAAPTRTVATPSSARPAARSANAAGGHRFADPYAAPGASATSGVRPSHPARASDAGAAIAQRRRNVEARRARTVRKAERANQVLVVRRSDGRPAGGRATARVSSNPRQSVAVAPPLGHAGALHRSTRSETSSAAAARRRSPASGDGPRSPRVTTSSTSRDEREQRGDRGPRGHGNRRIGPAPGARRQSPAAPSPRRPASWAQRPRDVSQWFNSINEDRAPSDQSHGGRSRRQRAADRGRGRGRASAPAPSWR